MLSVSELNEQAKSLLETTFDYVEVKGEISRLTKHSSGHWYFTLKDEKAAVSAVMYRMNNAKLKFDVTDAMKVVIYGKVSLYTPSGSYQLVATTLRPDGEGELELAFRQLKERLEREGLFEISHKKPIPRLPKRIALVTSSTSAALQDMLKVVSTRWKLSKILIFDALTQGENAPSSLIRALKKADLSGADVIVLARGGGSREDLWCFNDEGLARAIYDAATPVVSAIGHEIDYVISDFVADRRALTPSAAMLDILPDSEAFLQYIDKLEDELRGVIGLKLANKKSRLEILASKFSTNAIKARIKLKFSEIKNKQTVLNSLISSKILKLGSDLKSLEKAYEMREIFFESTKDLIEVRMDGKNVALEALKSGDEVRLISQSTHKTAKIL
ncbi:MULTISPECIES: exodeoxyribonuclease VII large subunit [Campylobacter]|uniref:exodeoxyribonuclease VII large subunit n=1 Tax=Campylobacter TaxID=194 RepID=UPI00146FD0C4|nr:MULTISPECIES: exodeoxyribonuclease VII large subunit [Campylobacter]MBN7288204.1 exodeoxyribonuclease VII large subunit [Campylobacter curvus]MDU6827101.1 exodeoxyribonuclease VII large subunit [Campylobacter sp.]